MADKVVSSKKGEGKALWFLGGLFEIKVASDDAGGICVVEMTILPGPQSSPPPHKHGGFELAYVLEGTGRFHVDGRTIEGGPGTVVYFPKGTTEWPETTGSTPAKFLLVYSGPMDKFFSEAGESAKSRNLPPPSSTPPDVARLTVIAKKHGLELLPPPKR